MPRVGSVLTDGQWAKIVSSSDTSGISMNSHRHTALGVTIISDRNPQAFHSLWQAGPLRQASPRTDTRIKLVVQAQSQPDNIASIPLLTATFVRPVRPVAGR